MIKLLALDLDGILLDSTGKVSEENRRAMREAEKASPLLFLSQI